VNASTAETRAGATAAPAVTISVIVPTLDEEAVIAECLSSVGSGKGTEVVLSDGGSRDSTTAVARASFPGLLVVEGAAGRGAQLNRGAAAASGVALLFLHADCRLPTGWQAAVCAAVGDPGVALGCFRLHTEPPRGTRGGRAARAWWRLLDMRGRGWGLPYGDQGLFVRRETFAEVGGFPEIPLMEDLEFVLRCRRRGSIARLALTVHTRARRFARHPLRARACTATFPLLYRLGMPPARLARWYGNVR
jgi:uncharacterized protein